MQQQDRSDGLTGQRLDPGSDNNWESPIPLGRFNLPGFPLEAIPQRLCVFRTFCEAVAESYQVPPDLPALLALAVSGAALAKRIEVHDGGDWREPVNLFVVVVMESGERKSAVFRVVAAPLAKYEREETERLAPVIEAKRTELTILAASLKHAQSVAAKAKKREDRDSAKQRARELSEELRNAEVILAPRCIADDATPEALSRLLSEQGGRMALLSPEGDTFDLMAGRYSGDRKPNLGVYLKGHAGDDLRVDRVNKDRPPEYVHGPALTVGLAVQPDVLRGLMQKHGFRGRGLLARFVYSLPNSLVGHRKLNPVPVLPATAKGYCSLIRAALQLEPAIDTFGKAQPHIVRAGADALVELDEFRARVEQELRDDGKLASMRDWGSKLAGAVCRIAGIFHGLIHAQTGNPAKYPLDAETIVCAMAIGEYAVAHARAAYFEMGADPAIVLARRILAWIAEERLSEFTRRDAFNRTRGTVHKVDELDAPLRLLTDHGYVRERLADRIGPGRKPSTPYKVNPLFLAQNTHNTHNPESVGNSAYSAQFAQGVQS